MTGQGWLASLSRLVRSLFFRQTNSFERQVDAFRANPNHVLLFEILKRIDHSVVIHDGDMRTLWWNEHTTDMFPGVKDVLKQGVTMQDIIALSQGSKLTKRELSSRNARAFAEGVIATVKAGKQTRRLIPLADGTLIHGSEFSLGNGYYASIRKDVTEVHELSRKVEELEEAMETAQDRNQQFSSMAAHDLVSPLRQVNTLLDFIVDDIEDAGQQLPDALSEHIDDAQSAIRRMHRLIGDLLNYALTGARAAEMRIVNMADSVTFAVQIVGPPQGFEVTCTSDLPDIHVPPAACGIVLRNLIANAIKHHDRDRGKIQVSGRIEDGMAVIDVMDDGPGIADSAKMKVFEPFERSVGTTRRSGCGLGLAMVANTIQAWGGEISIGDAPERGSIFRFTAPLPPEGALVGDAGEEVLRRQTGTG